MIYAILAWIVASGSILTVWFRARQVARVELPATATLLERVRKSAEGDPDRARSAAKLELDELLLEVDHQTRGGAELPRALSRVSLASGTALALLALIEGIAAPSWLAVGGAFLGGFAGMFGSAALGRVVEARARRAREHWSGVVRRAYTQL